MQPERARETYDMIAAEIERSFETTVRALGSEPNNPLVHTGDFAGGWQESGIGDQRAHHAAIRGMQRLRATGKPVYVAPGNHDSGYRGELGGEMSVASLEVCREIYGPLFWTFRQDTTLCLGVCSSIAEYHGQDEQVRKMQREQFEFIGDTLTGKFDPWILIAHSFTTPRYLCKAIAPHIDRLSCMIIGDLHNPAYASFVHALGTIGSLDFTGAIVDKTWATCLKRAVLCPSVAPLWWRGYAHLRVMIQGFGFVASTLFHERPADSIDLPVRSPLRGLAWMGGIG
jgi:hypothetical protein